MYTCNPAHWNLTVAATSLNSLPPSFLECTTCECLLFGEVLRACSLSSLSFCLDSVFLSCSSLWFLLCRWLLTLRMCWWPVFRFWRWGVIIDTIIIKQLLFVRLPSTQLGGSTQERACVSITLFEQCPVQWWKEVPVWWSLWEDVFTPRWEGLLRISSGGGDETATFNNYFKLITDVDPCNTSTRKAKTRQFAWPQARSNSRAKMLTYGAIKIWSEIPLKIKNKPCLKFP